MGLDSATVDVVGSRAPRHERDGVACTSTWRGSRRSPWSLEQAEIVGVLTPSARALDPTARGMLPFSSLRFPSRSSYGIDVDGHVLWGLTLRLLDDLVPRLLAGEWDV